MKRVILLVILALLAGCIPGKIVREDQSRLPSPADSSKVEDEREPPESAEEEPSLPDDLAPVIEVGDDDGQGEAGEELIREHYIIEGSSSVLVRSGNPRVSEIVAVHGLSDSLEFWGDIGRRSQSDRPERDEIHLEGNAKIIDRLSIITGEEGIYSPLTRIAVMLGDVEILDEGVVIHCERASWDRRLRRSVLTDSVSINYEGKTILADSVIYDQRSRFAEATGNVVVIDPASGIRILGGHGSFDLDGEITIMDDAPVLYRDEESDSSRTTAQIMRHFRSDSLMVAVGDVHYASEEMHAYGDSAIFFQAIDRMDLFLEPRLVWGANELSGDSLHLFFEEADPTFMEVIGNAVYTEANPDSTFFGDLGTRIDGDRFDIYFESGDLKEVRVDGKAHSVYIPALEIGEAAQLHETRGDSMNILFEEEELEQVRVIGTSEGESWSLENWDESASLEDSLPPVPFLERASSYKYRADDILFNVIDEEVFLVRGPAEIEDDFHLNADSIHLHMGDEFLTALGDPVFIDGEQELYGVRMEYDLAASQGMVFDGVTTLGTGFFSGPLMKKVGDQEINVSEALYTTCDLTEDQHSGFYMARVKAEGEKVYAAPVTLKIGKVPIFTVPTFFLDLKKGRRSGVLIPNFEFGINAERQRFIRNLGYYFALNDYTDLLLRGDYIEDNSVLGSATFRYNRRYWRGGKFNGDWRYDRKSDLGENGSSSWGLLGSHSMTVGDTRISAKANYASSSTLREIDNYTIDQTINQRLTSSLTMSTKLFGTLPFSTGFNMTQHMDKEDDDPDTDNLLRDVSTPVSLSWPGLSIPLGLGLKLTLPSFKYSRNQKTYETRDVVTESIPLGTNLSRTFNILGITLRPSAGTSMSFKRTSDPVSESTFVPFGVGDNPESGSPLSPEGESGEFNEVEREFQEGWKSSRSNSASLSASIKWFGLFYPGENMPSLGPVTAIRHTFSPSANFNYAENFAEGSKSISRNVSMSIDQTFDFKTGLGEKERTRNGVLTWSLKTTLNPELWPNENPWGRLSSNLRLKPGGGTSVQMSHAWDPNTWELQSSNLSGSFSKTLTVRIGSFLAREEEDPEIDEMDEAHRPDLETKSSGAGVPVGIPGSFGSDNAGFGASMAGGSPGELSLNTSFSLSRSGSGQLSPNLRLNSSFQLSDNWSLSWSGDLELENGSFGTQRFSVVRNLHCWEAQFTNLIFQGEPQYYFLIFLREHAEVKQEFGNRGVSGQRGLY
jgi:hypothetical protein